MRPLRTRLIGWLALVLGCAMPCLAARVVVDEKGRRVTVPDHPHRIICLVPSITDTVFSIGEGPDVVGITDYVEYPAEAKSRANVGAIDTPSIEAILNLHPDLILGTPPPYNQQSTLDRLEQLGIPVFLVDPHGIQGILNTIASVGRATNHEAAAAAEIARLNARMDAVRRRVRDKPVIQLFMPLSVEPVITIGRGAFITELVTLAGAHSVTDDIQQEWPQVSLEAVVERAPQALLLMRDGHTTLASLRDRPGWKILPAVRNGRVYYADNRVNFPSPIAIDELEDLARQFHP
jgi:iron complex transport system substrate-binding protein